MNTPLIIFNDVLPQELLDIIQQYLPINDNIRSAIKNYYDYLYEQKILIEEEYEDKYVALYCTCPNFPNNGVTKLFRRKECWYCDEHDYNVHTNKYASDQYYDVVLDNPQYSRIAYNDWNNDDDEDEEFYNNIRYNENILWLE